VRANFPKATVGQIRPDRLRLHGLDTLRGIAALLVVLLHAGVPYMTRPLSHLVWPAIDGCPCPVIDAIVWCIECFIMPLFFVLAGFLSAGLLALNGPRAFLEHRTKRLLWPQIAATITILPFCFYLWAWGWVADGLFAPRGFFIVGVPSELKAEMWGTAHLWFLEYLYIYCVVLWGATLLRDRMPNFEMASGQWQDRLRGRIDRMMLSPLKPLLPAIPCALILYRDPRIVLGFYQTFLPVASKLLYYAIYYFTGVSIHRHHRSLFLQARYGKRFLAAAAALFALVLPAIHQYQTAGLTGFSRAYLAVMLALFAWLATYGLLGSFLLARRGYNAVTKYLAEASYWVYLIHLPFVVLAQIALAPAPIPALLKFAVSGAATTSLALLTYQAFVRYTRVGELLNGQQRRRPVSISTSAILAMQSPPVIASLNGDKLKAA
jgi:peptidoglycan/LPS O-acetylase OafA/YrhL